MRVLLIYPPVSLKERYSSEIGHAGGRQIPLGIYYLASYLQTRKKEVCVLDAEALGLAGDDILGRIREYDPQVVGLSSTTVAFRSCLRLAGLIKMSLPHIVTVIGGPHASTAAGDVMRHREFDYAVIGEGEESLDRLLDALAIHGDGRALPGVAFRDRDGTPHLPEKASPLLDIDSLPFPAYEMIPDLDLYRPPPMNYRQTPVANIITSRGCPNQCTFCGHSVFGRVLRQRDPENIADEIELLHDRYHVREIAFVDDTFTINPARLRSLFDILRKRRIAFPWTCMSRINTVNEEMLRHMKDHGCWHISFGIESGNADILRLIKKNISLDSVRKVVVTCHELGLLTKGFFIIGHPGESLRTIEQTIRFALDIPLDDIVVTLNTPLPGTEQFETADRFGRVDRSDWTKYSMWNPVFVPAGLSAEDLVRKHREFYRRFYLRPRIMWRYARSFGTQAGWGRAQALLRSVPFLLRSPGAVRRDGSV